MDKIIEKFLSSKQALIESKFAILFTGRKDVSVQWRTDTDTCYTDGTVITLNPETFPKITDKDYITQICRDCGYPANFANPEKALAIAVRGLNLHECLHIILTPFKESQSYVSSIKTKLEEALFLNIFNFFEDRYIENKGIKIYPTIKTFLNFINDIVKYEYTSKTEIKNDNSKSNIITDVLRWLFFKYKLQIDKEFPQIPDETLKEKIIPLSEKAISDDNGNNRLECASEITNLLKKYIPEEEAKKQELFDILKSILEILQASTSSGQENNSISQASTLQMPLPGNPQQINSILNSLKMQNTNNSYYNAESDPQDLQSSIHHESKNRSADIINTTVMKVEPNPDDIIQAAQFLKTNKIAINKTAQTFRSVVFSEDREFERKHQFGNILDTKNLGDAKKRFWCNTVYTENTANLAVVMLIDRSGSMIFTKEQTDKIAATVLCALSKCNIPFVVGCHNSIKSNTVYNVGNNSTPLNTLVAQLFSVCSHHDSDELASLKWAESEIRKIDAEKKLIVSVSDGCPQNSKEAADYIQALKKSRIFCCALSMNDTFEELSKIYPKCIACNEPKDVAKSFVSIVKKALLLR